MVPFKGLNIFCCMCTILHLCTTVYSDASDACPPILTHEDWGGDNPVKVDYRACPLNYVVVHHTVTRKCETRAKCSELIQSIQNFHIDELDFNDIGYNFLIGSDGNVYEGTGWHRVGAHTKGYNTRSIGLALIGNFSEMIPDDIQLKTARTFLECAVKSGELSSNYILIGAKQVSATLSPGRRLYSKIKSWPNYVADPKSKQIQLTNCTVHLLY